MMGLQTFKSVLSPRSTYYDYNDRGQVTYIWGDVPYPEKREYNQFGDQTTLTTYPSGTGWYSSTWPGSTGTGDVTTWYFDEATDLLTNRTDAAGEPVKFDCKRHARPFNYPQLFVEQLDLFSQLAVQI
jgi:hypothetical protein